MAKKRRRSRLTSKVFTRSELKKKSKSSLIRLILMLQAKLLRRSGIRRRRAPVRRRKSSRRRTKSRAGTIKTIRMRNGQTRKVRVLANGQFRFLKGKGKKSRRRTSRRRR